MMETGQLGYINLQLARPAVEDALSDRRYTWTARTGTPDHSGRITDTDGWELTDFMGNPVIFAGHGWLYGKWPIGAATDIRITGDSLVAETRFATSREAQDVQQRVDQGIVKGMSAAWIGIESEPIDPARPWGARHFKRQSLLELSIVPLGDDPRAIRIAGFGTLSADTPDEDETLTQIQAAIQEFKESPIWTP